MSVVRVRCNRREKINLKRKNRARNSVSREKAKSGGGTYVRCGGARQPAIKEPCNYTSLPFSQGSLFAQGIMDGII